MSTSCYMLVRGSRECVVLYRDSNSELFGKDGIYKTIQAAASSPDYADMGLVEALIVAWGREDRDVSLVAMAKTRKAALQDVGFGSDFYYDIYTWHGTLCVSQFAGRRFAGKHTRYELLGHDGGPPGTRSVRWAKATERRLIKPPQDHMVTTVRTRPVQI